MMVYLKQMLQYIYFRANTKQFIIMFITIAAQEGEKNYPSTKDTSLTSCGHRGHLFRSETI